MKLEPLADRVVVKMCEEQESKSALILTSASKVNPQFAEVIAVGPGGVVDGKEVKMTVAIGDKVVVSKYAGNEVKLGDEEYIIVRVQDILAKVVK